MIGGIDNDHLERHQVTGCVHGHTASRQGAAKAGGSEVGSRMTQLSMQKQQQDAQFSLSSWLQKTLGGGKTLLRGIWGTDEASEGLSGVQSGNARLTAQVGDTRAAADKSAVDGLKAAQQSAQLQGNPYFAAMQERSTHMTPFQKARARVVAAAERLTGRLPGKAFRFQTKNSFQAKQQRRSREELRRRSKYKKDALEIDCVLTDESYLMDSYDRKGEYRQLTTKD